MGEEAGIAGPDGDAGREDRRRYALDLTGAQTRSAPGLPGALERVCLAITTALDLHGATVTLAPGDGTQVLVAASSAEVRSWEQLQFDMAEGPTRDAVAQRRPVLVADVSLVAVDRWLAYTPTALAAGVGSVFAFPLHIGAAFFGVLTLYRAPAGPLSRADLDLALVFVDITNELFLDSIQSSPDGIRAPDGRAGADLTAALDKHGYVYQAQGMVMVQHGVSLSVALAMMRAHAFATGKGLTELARAIVEDRFTLPGADE